MVLQILAHSAKEHSMQKEILSKVILLDNKGHLQTAGYAKQFNFEYNKANAKRRPFSLKEWDFYQVLCGSKVIQLTIGHVSYCSQVSASIIDLETGQRRDVSSTKFLPKKLPKQMPTHPEKPHVLQYFRKNMHMQFSVEEKQRKLTFSCFDKLGLRAEIDLTFTNVGKNKEKMAIATPFAKSRQWYLNYKENCFVVNGVCQIDDMFVEVVDGNGLLDWGRGVWPRKHGWTWGNGSTVVDGKHFGFNIGWGFGNTANATENMFFYDNKAYKLGTVTKKVRKNGKIRYQDEEGKFVLDMTTTFDNFTETKAPFVHNTCHQVFGTWQGKVQLDDGTVLEIPPFVAFCEEANNKW